MLHVLQRLYVSQGAQIGAIADELARVQCFTLEDEPHAVKVPGETCIPAGRYALKLRNFGGLYEKYRLRFPWNEPGMLWLQDVPNFTDIMLHCGATKADTLGCVLVGCGAFSYGAISESAKAYEPLYKKISGALLNGEQCYLDVRGIPWRFLS